MKFNIFGYISIGDIVPEVRITLWNFSKTDFIPIDESRQASVNKGLNLTESSGNGSTMIEKPFKYVEIVVANSATVTIDLNSSVFDTWRVFNKVDNLFEQNDRAF